MIFEALSPFLSMHIRAIGRFGNWGIWDGAGLSDLTIAGVTISPVAFLVINKGEVSVKYICEGSESSAERIIGMVPDVVNKVGDIVNKFNGDKKENKDDSVFAEE